MHQLQLASQRVKLQNHDVSMDDMKKHLADQHQCIIELSQRLDEMDRKMDQVIAENRIKGCVISSLETEVNRLQQYTRRYSIIIAGVDRPRNESNAELKEKVESIIGGVNSSTTPADIDKFHRNGPIKNNSQEIIVRFKTHSAKETLYKQRKTLNDNNIKIRPSLTPNTKKLLHEAEKFLETNRESFAYSEMDNLPDFVFANVHGELHVKMAKRVKKGMFFKFNTLDELIGVISNAQDDDQVYSTLYESLKEDLDQNSAFSD